MARTGWDCKSAARVLDMSPKKIPQALVPTFRKVAKLMLDNPSKTLAELQNAIDEEESLRKAPQHK